MRTTALICAFFVLLGTLTLPIGYYTLLRIVLSIGSLWILHSTNDNHIEGWDYFFITTLIVFNPILPVYLNKEIWRIIDILAGLGFLLFAIKTKAE